MTFVLQMEATVRDVPDGTGDLVRRRRAELGAFLRSRRSALRPDDIGVDAVGRRHVKGLRREEVAAAAGIGVSWYTMLEQGRVERVTARTLDAIASVLRLSGPEREHLRNLGAASSASLAAPTECPPPALVAFVTNYPLGGAHLHDSRFDLVAWSSWSDELFEFTTTGGAQPNLLRVMAFAPARVRARLIDTNWMDTFRTMVGHFRVNYSAYGGTGHQALVDELCAQSPEFRQIWAQERLAVDPPTERQLIDHPRHGKIATSVFALRSPACPSYTLILNNVEPAG